MKELKTFLTALPLEKLVALIQGKYDRHENSNIY